MANSPLVTYTRLSPNHSGRRTHAIDRITPHAVVGQLSVERICDCFKDSSRQASCNYCIGAFEAASFSGLTSEDARIRAYRILTTVREQWRATAADCSLKREEQNRMAPAFALCDRPG